MIIQFGENRLEAYKYDKDNYCFEEISIWINMIKIIIVLKRLVY